jgi:hypothetical protein
MERLWAADVQATPIRPAKRTVQPAMVALQRAVGNQAMERILQRQPKQARLKPKPVSAERAGYDYTDADTFITDWFADNYAVLHLREQAEAEAIKNFAAFTDIKDPPDLSVAIIGAVFDSALSLIPGGSLIKTGITMGVFAHDIAGLKKRLTADDIELDTSQLSGPSEGHKKTAEKIHGAYETGHKIGEGAVKVKEAYDKVQEQRRAATEAQARASEMAELGIKRLSKFEDAIAALQTQRHAARQWLKEARDANRHRGELSALVATYLGPSPKLGEAKESISKKLAENFELAFYKAKYGDLMLYRSTLEWADTTEVLESYFTTGEQYVRNDRWIKDSSLTMAVRLRIATLLGNPGLAYDDVAIGRFLGISTIVRTAKDNRSKAEVERGQKELQQKYGRRMPGEI